MTSQTKPAPLVEPVVEPVQETLGEYFDSWFKRIRGGDLGSLPIIVGVILIALIFGLVEPLFFSARNFVNLLLQMAGITTIAIGVVFVLLIAEIDLSVGFVSGVGGVVMTLLLRESATDWPWYAAIGAGLLSTVVIGFLHGVIITKAGVPSFVVTLAGLLAWSGVVLILTTVLSNAGTITIQDPIVLGIANAYIPQVWGWLLFVLVIGGIIASQVVRQQTLRRQGLAVKPVSVLALQSVALTLVTGGTVWYANTDRGVPVVAVLVLIMLAFWSFIAFRTKFGRYVYAVGGNPEAARRAGINVDRIRIQVFMISSFMAGVGGVILASRLRSVDTNTGGGNLLLNAIAAAVIGGTSLFGGSGSVMSAFLGALIIASVENGMGLLGLPSGVKFVVNGLVLLVAVLIDAFSRRSRESSGLR
ncbi:MAG: ABC transporter permease [Chloroflexi bacterium]|nr:ABC transporter permease [Chloroflexota bacterium]